MRGIQGQQLMGDVMRNAGLTVALVMLAAVPLMTPAAAAPVPDVMVEAEMPVVTEQMLSDTYLRLQKLNQAGATTQGYQLSKALMFLEQARREFYLRNHSGIVYDFVESAQIIAQSLESGIYIGLGNRRYKSSEPVAPLLWRQIEQLKNSTRFVCVEDRIARAEVYLLAAGNDQFLLGWRAAVTRIRLAEQELNDAERVVSC